MLEALIGLQPTHLRLEPGGAECPIGASVQRLGDFEIRLDESPGRLRWSIRNTATEARRLRSIALVQNLGQPRGPLEMLRNGLQSWSAIDVITFGEGRDPSWQSPLPEAFHAAHNADERMVSQANEIRSEGVTLLRRRGGPELLIGFAGGTRHDGTIRVREGSRGVELVVEAFLGEALLEPGVEVGLHDILHASGDSGDTLLATWADEVGRAGEARASADLITGWCSWYHYFADVTEADIRSNLALARDWPFDVFQIDDGYQRTIGDWLVPGERFQSPIAKLGADIRATGMRPGIWLAPFLVAPDSVVTREHPEWLARDSNNNFVIGMIHPVWGGGLDGLMFTLDTTRADVQEHLESTARAMVSMGYDYLKLDFTYAPRMPGIYADPSQTPAQRIRAGYDAIRRGAGEKTFLLGCGAPLLACVGVVDGMRIGADVSPTWEVDVPKRDGLSYGPSQLPGYEATQPSTANALAQTLRRSFMHRRLWLNDPDCLMLRRSHTSLSEEQIRTWAEAVASSGGFCVLSDDLALLGDRERSEFEALLATARERQSARGRAFNFSREV